MPMLSKLDLWNRALGRLPAAPVSDEDENSLEARECRRFYPEALRDMLEGPHNWSFAIRRVSLAALATNDRENEWGYAYALPSGAAGSGSLSIIPDFEALGLDLPVPLPGQPYMETWASQLTSLEIPYIIEGGTLYTNTENAVLAYTITDIEGIDLPGLVITALTLDLASRLAVPVKKDSDREQKLLGMAEVAWQRAIADDRNRQPQRAVPYTPEAMAARQGYFVEGL